jgi:hypothetical protein
MDELLLIFKQKCKDNIIQVINGALFSQLV